MPNTPQKDLSLKSLELFQLCANKGSLQAAARDSGLSLSTVSHHLRSLEDHLGVELFNHNRRPMVLTPRGQAFLRNIEDALLAIRKARAEASSGSIADASFLRVGVIEDFDTDIVPELAVFLSSRMPKCDFTYVTDHSHSIVEKLRNHTLDIGVVAGVSERLGDLLDQPLLRDPFVVVVPKGTEPPIEDIVAGKTELPFLRFTANLIIARQIETHLRRIGHSHPHRFECDSNQTLMAMVASGAGWTITTPLLYTRAERFHDRVKMRPFPGKSFSRSVSIIRTPDCSTSVGDLVDGMMRKMISEKAIQSVHETHPWLKDRFRLI
ncbi:MAG: LysR family transcriptional regulator [Paracoccaceae bacterium]|nr:LysR family transcriptional regulator [Paracoccaceae bacterium]MDP7186086.1 LysR family transcriptional regulator [Paracoccaceae bacterium]